VIISLVYSKVKAGRGDGFRATSRARLPTGKPTSVGLHCGKRFVAALAACIALAGGTSAGARSPVAVGTLAAGPLDGITDVPGVRVGNVTKIEGTGALVPGVGPVRTGATAILPNGDPWKQRPAAGWFMLNGNGEMTGTHWIDESGFMSSPIVLTDTLDIGRADDGVIAWMIAQHPEIGVHDDTPLPVVAECDDAALNDIQGRHVSADDVVKLLNAAKPGDFARGSVGAGTGMLAFGFKAGIGSASRVLPATAGGYTVGVLVNDNTGSAPRANLTIDGVHVGRAFSDKLLPVFPSRRSALPASGHVTDGSIIIIIATDAPLDTTKLRELAKRATIGLARSGSNSKVSSGDLFLAFSTTHLADGDGAIAGPPLVAESSRIDQLYTAVADATEEAIDDALFSARTMTGRDGITFYGLPYDQVAPLLHR
jgi:D-aminopeptidase